MPLDEKTAEAIEASVQSPPAALAGFRSIMTHVPLLAMSQDIDPNNLRKLRWGISLVDEALISIADREYAQGYARNHPESPHGPRQD